MPSSSPPQKKQTTFLTLPHELRQKILVGTIASLLEPLSTKRRKRNRKNAIRCLSKRSKKAKAHAELLRDVHAEIVDDVNYVEKLCMDMLRVRTVEWNVKVFGNSGHLLEDWENE